MTSSFTVSSSELTDRILLSIAGEIDVHAIDLLEASIRWSRSQRDALDLDLSGVTFIDSGGLNVLIAPLANGYPVRIVAASPAVAGILRLTSLVETFGFTPDPHS